MGQASIGCVKACGSRLVASDQCVKLCWLRQFSHFVCLVVLRICCACKVMCPAMLCCAVLVQGVVGWPRAAVRQPGRVQTASA
jgi:hypothetical protein